ncbi:MAG: hypothetical protein HY710_05750 [Candidatus Latescibacteria bacterium]|nr:hypothetical protein [Candidatus Latescibacterota bacterium]
MNSSTLSEIEDKINQLSYDEQLGLIERLAHRLRNSMMEEQNLIESQLVAMAADPEIRNELRKIEQEFAPTEMDGLEKT